MNAGRRWMRAGGAEIMVLLGAGALLAAWVVAAWWGRRAFEGRLGEDGWWATAFNTLALLALDGAVIAAICRRPSTARVGATALLATLPCLPFLMPAHLEWLSAIRVGGYGCMRWGLVPQDFYAFLRERRWDFGTPSVAAGALVALLVARLAAADVVWSGRGRRGVVVALLGVATLIGEALYASATRPSVERWLDAFPVLARVRVRDVPRDPDQTGRWFSPVVRLTRRGTRSSDEREIIRATATRLPDGRGGTLSGDPWDLECPLDESLILRRGPLDGTMLLACGAAPPTQRTRHRAEREAREVIEVHHWEIKVYNFYLVGRVAPPAAWCGLAALALAASGVLLRRRRPHPTRAAEHPYRSPLARAGGHASDEASRALAMRVGGVVIAVHGAAPLVMHAWVRLFLLRSG